MTKHEPQAGRSDTDRLAFRMYAAVTGGVLLILTAASLLLPGLNYLIFVVTGVSMCSGADMTGCVVTLWTVAGVTLVAPLVTCAAVYTARYHNQRKD